MKPKTFRIIPALLFLMVSCAPHRAGPTVPVSSLSPGETLSPTISPTPEGTLVPAGPMADVYAALDAYEPPYAWPETIAALTSGIARWLAQGNDPALLPDLLRASPKLQTVRPETAQADLNSDGQEDIVVQTQRMGLPVLAFLRQGGEYTGLALPDRFDDYLPTLRSGFISDDLTGDGHPETVITYTVLGGSSSTELLYVFRWHDVSPTLIFRADLITWAGPSTWTMQPDPTAPGQQQLVLTYPYIYRDGFDHKMVTHPLGWQVWRWDEGVGRFVLAEKGVDLDHSADGPHIPVTISDRLRWETNEGETAFRAGDYEVALERYGKVLAMAETWSRESYEPDWRGVARFRRGEILLLMGRTEEARAEMRALAGTYAGDLLGELAAACLAGASDNNSPEAPARCIAAMQKINLWHLMDEQCGKGALCFPLYSTGVLYPPAGLTAYLNAYPELGEDPEAVRVGLQSVGFIVERVQRTESGNLWMVVQAGGTPTEWTLARDASGQWRPHWPPACPSEFCWPVVGGWDER
ncbi:MAG: tetratricopeptide repeat protein [Chloroflexi bacterium]|nr:tetratricopeptide repeat protein [Chloroflexota bacterium]